MNLSDGYGIAIWQEIPDTWEHYFEASLNNILLKSGNKYYTYEDDGFIEVEPTEENFSNTSVEDIMAHYQELQNPYIVHWSKDQEIPTLTFTGDIDAINKFNDVNILGYTSDEEIEIEGQVSGIPKDNYYKYRVTINDTATSQDPDDILKDWSDWKTQNVTDSVTVPAGYVNKVNPYLINVDVEQFNDVKLSAYGQVVLYNEDPFFMIGMVSYNTLSVTIDDPDSDKIKYQVWLNDEKVYPKDDEWSDFYQTPYPVIYKLDKSKINIGEVNSCVVIAQDEFGAESSLDLSFVGFFDGLLFADKDGDYYSLDPDTILKRLDFGTIVAGLSSDVAMIKVVNQNHFKVKNINITLDKKEIQPHTDILLSKEDGDNFNPQSSLLFSEEVESGEEVIFYIKVETGMLAGGFSEFRINVNADIVEN